MAGTITVTSSEYIGTLITVYSVAWVSDGATGAVSGNTMAIRRGFLRQVRYIPNTGGTAPTNLYDLTLVDADGFDVLLGTGANLSGTVNKIVCPILSDGAASAAPSSRLIFLDSGDYTPTVGAAGNSKGGTFVLFVGGDVGS